MWAAELCDVFEAPILQGTSKPMKHLDASLQTAFGAALAILMFAIQPAQAQNRAPQAGGPWYTLSGGAAPQACVTGEQTAHLIPQLRAQANALLDADPGLLERLSPEADTRGIGISHVTFASPIRHKGEFEEPGYYAVTNFVDHNLSPSTLSDYNCGTRTYDWATGNHEGTDYILWPYAWKRMDENVMEFVAAAPGVIVGKVDGNFDRNCTLSGATDWNAVYVLHSDSSISWYLHLKSGSITSKGIGETVAEGEYLGTAGSSGSSTIPHLHFAVYDKFDNLVDPYMGTCNGLNPDSWWISQEDYWVPGINHISTHSGLPVEDCPDPEITNEQAAFDHGDTVFLMLWYKDLLNGALTELEILDPTGATYDDWDFVSPWDDFSAAWAYWFFIPTSADPTGAYTFRADFAGQTYEREFWVGDMPSGLTPSDQDLDWTLYPNPSAGSVTVDYAALPGQPLEVSVYDATGRLQQQHKGFARTGENTWTLQHLAPGSYTVQLRAGNRTSHRLLMVAR